MGLIGAVGKIAKKLGPKVVPALKESGKFILGGLDYIAKKQPKQVLKTGAKVAGVGIAGTAGYSYVKEVGVKQTGKDILTSGNYLIKESSQFGSNVGAFRNNPTAQNFGKIYSDSPLIAGTATAGVLYIGGKSVQGAYNAYQLNKLTSSINNAQSSMYNVPDSWSFPVTDSIPKPTKTIDLKPNKPDNSKVYDDVIPTPTSDKSITPQELTPFSEQPKTNSKTSAKRRKVLKPKAKPQNINIRVYNNNQDGNYIRNKR